MIMQSCVQLGLASLLSHPLQLLLPGTTWVQGILKCLYEKNGVSKDSRISSRNWLLQAVPWIELLDREEFSALTSPRVLTTHETYNGIAWSPETKAKYIYLSRNPKDVALSHSNCPIRTHNLCHVTGYQPIRDQYFLIRSVSMQARLTIKSSFSERTSTMMICLHLLRCSTWVRYPTGPGTHTTWTTWRTSTT
eukprot:sb/3471021/